MAVRLSVPPISVRGGRVLGGESSLPPRALRTFLSSADPIPEGTAERWLILLRWLAILGMAATTGVARLVAPGLRVGRIFLLLVAIGVLNGVFALVVSRLLRPAFRLVAAQIAFDVVALGAVLWVSGGTGNPFASFLVFQIALAGILCNGRATLLIAVLTVAVAALVSFAEPLSLANSPLGEGRAHHLGAFVSIASVSALLGFSAFVVARRVDELRARAVRNEKLAMLGRVVGGMSHELSTPLATILLAGRELVEMTKATNADAAELAGTIAGEAQRASDIIGLVRGYIRPDQRREEVELGKVVSEVASRELRRLGFRGEVMMDAPEPVVVTVFPAGLLQVLVNVLTNASEAARGMASPSISILVRGGADFAEIVVEDSGPGFSESILSRLGEPFQTTKEREGGMGLGLYVSSVILDRMNGALSVGNAEGGGARVVIRFERGVMQRDSEV